MRDEDSALTAVENVIQRLEGDLKSGLATSVLSQHGRKFQNASPRRGSRRKGHVI